MPYRGTRYSLPQGSEHCSERSIDYQRGLGFCGGCRDLYEWYDEPVQSSVCYGLYVLG